MLATLAHRRRRAGKDELIVSKNMSQSYEDPDQLGSRGRGNYELTQCPAYESTTIKPHPPEVEENNDYEL